MPDIEINPDLPLLDGILRKAIMDFFGTSGTMLKIFETAHDGYLCGFSWNDADSSVHVKFLSEKRAKEFVAQWNDSAIVFKHSEWYVYIVKVNF